VYKIEIILKFNWLGLEITMQFWRIHLTMFVAACRTSSGKPLSSFVANSSSFNNHNNHSDSPSYNSLAIQQSQTSMADSKVKKAFGLKSPGLDSKKSPGSGSGSI
jgi:hypothetical protein